MKSMLPALPKSFGRLSDVFTSALGSITGTDNRLGLAKARSSAVIMVDGLGSANLREAGGHAPFLNQLLAKHGSIGAVFPSTTAASLSSFATGVMPGRHGILGYSVLVRETGTPLNMLNGWGAAATPADWQLSSTVATVASTQGVETFFVGPTEYEGSGFTEIIMRGANYVVAESMSQRLVETLRLLGEGNSRLIYCYIPELDQAAHAKGAKSNEWLSLVEELNREIATFAKSIPSKAGALVTADHGIVDVPSENHLFLDEVLDTEPMAVTGDPRCQFVYLRDSNAASKVADELNSKLLGQAVALTRDEVIESGLYGDEALIAAINRMPDVFIVAVKNCAMYHRDFSSPKSQRMIGQHGGVSDAELLVPLLKLGIYY